MPSNEDYPSVPSRGGLAWAARTGCSDARPRVSVLSEESRYRFPKIAGHLGKRWRGRNRGEIPVIYHRNEQYDAGSSAGFIVISSSEMLIKRNETITAQESEAWAIRSGSSVPKALSSASEPPSSARFPRGRFPIRVTMGLTFTTLTCPQRSSASTSPAEKKKSTLIILGERAFFSIRKKSAILNSTAARSHLLRKAWPRVKPQRSAQNRSERTVLNGISNLSPADKIHCHSGWGVWIIINVKIFLSVIINWNYYWFLQLYCIL